MPTLGPLPAARPVPGHIAAASSLASALVAVMLLAFPFAGAAYATLIVAESLETTAAAADRVLVADVLHVEGEFVDGHVRTRVELAPVADYDERPLPDTLVLHTPGGRTGDIATQVAGTPHWSPGDRVILFLHHAPDGSWQLRGLALGHFRMTPTPDGQWVVQRSLAGAEILERDARGQLKHHHGDVETTVDWDSFDARVRAAREAR